MEAVTMILSIWVALAPYKRQTNQAHCQHLETEKGVTRVAASAVMSLHNPRYDRPDECAASTMLPRGFLASAGLMGSRSSCAQDSSKTHVRRC